MEEAISIARNVLSFLTTGSLWPEMQADVCRQVAERHRTLRDHLLGETIPQLDACMAALPNTGQAADAQRRHYRELRGALEQQAAKHNWLAQVHDGMATDTESRISMIWAQIAVFALLIVFSRLAPITGIYNRIANPFVKAIAIILNAPLFGAGAGAFSALLGQEIAAHFYGHDRNRSWSIIGEAAAKGAVAGAAGGLVGMAGAFIHNPFSSKLRLLLAEFGIEVASEIAGSAAVTLNPWFNDDFQWSDLFTEGFAGGAAGLIGSRLGSPKLDFQVRGMEPPQVGRALSDVKQTLELLTPESRASMEDVYSQIQKSRTDQGTVDSDAARAIYNSLPSMKLLQEPNRETVIAEATHRLTGGSREFEVTRLKSIEGMSGAGIYRVRFQESGHEWYVKDLQGKDLASVNPLPPCTEEAIRITASSDAEAQKAPGTPLQTVAIFRGSDDLDLHPDLDYLQASALHFTEMQPGERGVDVLDQVTQATTPEQRQRALEKADEVMVLAAEHIGTLHAKSREKPGLAVNNVGKVNGKLGREIDEVPEKLEIFDKTPQFRNKLVKLIKGPPGELMHVQHFGQLLRSSAEKSWNTFVTGLPNIPSSQNHGDFKIQNVKCVGIGPSEPAGKRVIMTHDNATGNTSLNKRGRGIGTPARDYYTWVFSSMNQMAERGFTENEIRERLSKFDSVYRKYVPSHHPGETGFWSHRFAVHELGHTCGFLSQSNTLSPAEKNRRLDRFLTLASEYVQLSP